MYWCDENINQAFVSWWNGTAGCTGHPDEIELMWSTVGDMVCSGDNGALCDYGFKKLSWFIFLLPYLLLAVLVGFLMVDKM